MTEDWESKSDQELVRGAQTGLAGQGDVAEMSRRLKDSTKKLARTNVKLMWASLALTGVMLVLMIVQIIVAIVG